MTRQYGIIGFPLGHSLSPTLHNWGFGQAGLDAEYLPYPLEPPDLPEFMERVRSTPLYGLSVTIPHKRAIMDHLDHVTDRARSVGAVNTLYWDHDRLCGENTDVTGLMAPLRKLAALPSSAMVLGAGGAARAAVAAFRELGIKEIIVTNRTLAKAAQLARDFGVDHAPWEDRQDLAPGLICNTTPLGMAGELAGVTPWPGDRFPDRAVVYDIVYNPLRTRFLQEAEGAGCRTISGLEMFLHQGLAQFALWTGRHIDEGAARTLLVQALAQRAES